MIKIIISFLAILVAVIQTETTYKSLKVEINQVDGSTSEQDLIEFINNGKDKMSKSTTSRKRAIMVLGLTGVGKSTLVNYLNDIPLKCIKINGVWKIDLAETNQTLSCGFKIGHKNSETLYPSACTASFSKQVSFIDTPGFQDNRGFEIEIANSFFRQEILKQVEDLKFLLVLNHDDVINRRVQFFDTIKRFADFLGIFDKNESLLKKLAKSIGIIVSKVNNDGDDDEEVKSYLTELLLSSLDTNKLLNQNETYAIRQVLLDNQLEIFSNPRKAMPIDDTQKVKILKMINNLEYITRKEAQIRARIDRSHMSALNAYIFQNLKKFELNLEILLEKKISVYINNVVQAPRFEFNNSIIIRNLLNLLGDNRNRLFEKFMSSLPEEFLNNNEKAQAIREKQVLDYFGDLLPDEFRNQSFPLEKNWLSSLLVTRLNSLLSKKFYAHILDGNDKFNFEFGLILEKNVNLFIESQMRQAYDVEQVKIIIKNLNDFNVYLKSKEHINDAFIMGINTNMIGFDAKSNLSSELKSLQTFNELLPKDMKQLVSTSRYLIELSAKINVFINELDNFLTFEDFTFEKDVFIYKGYFSTMSSILSKINNAANIVNLKSIHIYSTNSLVIDVDFRVNMQRYSQHSPDLVIVSPRVKFNSRLTIDLSCYTQRGFPNGQSKAANGGGNGAAGHDGLPGLQGFNGGQFLIFTDDLFDSQKCVFKSKGGDGGPGQSGIVSKFIMKFIYPSLYVGYRIA